MSPAADRGGRRSSPKPRVFRTVGELRAWFGAHGSRAWEVWIAYPKKGTDRAGIRYPEALDEALCHGWIDGQVRTLGPELYANRFTPRRPGSVWSRRNVARVRELIAEGRMRPEGLRAFDARTPESTGIYTYEQGRRRLPRLDATSRSVLAADPRAWARFARDPPGYRRAMIRWIMEARRPETRSRRVEALRRASRAGTRVDPVHPYRAPMAPEGGS